MSELTRPTRLCDADNALLLVIDLQGKIFEMGFNRDRLHVLSRGLMRLAELFRVPVVLTEQYPRGLGPTEPEIRGTFDGLQTETHMLEKTSFGCWGEPAFAELVTRLAGQIRARRQGGPGRPVDVVVCGMETHVCVQQTVLELLGQPDLRVVVLADCVGGRVEAYHRVALERFRQCGAVISTIESLAFEWTRDKSDPRFKPMSALIKELADS